MSRGEPDLVAPARDEHALPLPTSRVRTVGPNGHWRESRRLIAVERDARFNPAQRPPFGL